MKIDLSILSGCVRSMSPGPAQPAPRTAMTTASARSAARARKMRRQRGHKKGQRKGRMRAMAVLLQGSVHAGEQLRVVVGVRAREIEEREARALLAGVERRLQAGDPDGEAN